MPRPSYSLDDPLSRAIAPPIRETIEERQAREATEELARKVSLKIDEALKEERQALRKAKKSLRVLLLGQSHAGKSTTIKNFQLQYNHQAWLEERKAWRTVIYLNLVRSVNTIIDVLDEEMTSTAIDNPLTSSMFPTLRSVDFETRSDELYTAHNFTSHHRVLKLRLGPLRRIQHDLERQLGAASSEPDHIVNNLPVSKSDVSSEVPPEPEKENRPADEFAVRSATGWKSAFKRFASNLATDSQPRNSGDNWPKPSGHILDVIIGCKEDIKLLWADETVQNVLKQRKLRLEDSSGFFLQDVDRIADYTYDPSDSDVVRARLRTTGVQEYRFNLDKDNEWVIYDFAGSRSSRAAWFPYFDNIQAIIFLAPLAAFDEYELLPDGTQMNRLQDSLQLWRTICSSKVIANVQLILFLNKCDLLAKRLKGDKIQVRDHIPGYKNRPNEYKMVANYFRSYFREVMNRCSPLPREFFGHYTTVVDTTSTALTLSAVKDAILVNALKSSDFI